MEEGWCAAGRCLVELSSDVVRDDAWNELDVQVTPAMEDCGRILQQRRCRLIRARALESFVYGTMHVTHIVRIDDNKDRCLIWSDEMIEMVLHPAVWRQCTIEPARICKGGWS